jgi:hypothetical protein
VPENELAIGLGDKLGDGTTKALDDETTGGVLDAAGEIEELVVGATATEGELEVGTGTAEGELDAGAATDDELDDETTADLD